MSANSVYTVGGFSEVYTSVYNSGDVISIIMTNTSTGGKKNGLINKHAIDEIGTWLWSASFGGTGNQNYNNQYNCVCADINNNAYAGGHFNGSSVQINNKQVWDPIKSDYVTTVFTTLSNINTTTPESYYMGLIVKYNSVGDCQWAIRLGGNSTVLAMNIDNNNNLYVAGRFYDLSFNIYNTDGTLERTVTNTYTEANHHCGFIIKYNPDGIVQWVLITGGTNRSITTQDTWNSIAIDSLNNIVLSCKFNDSVLQFYKNNTLIKSLSSYTSFVIKLDSDGNYLWAARVGNSQIARSVCVDLSYNIYTVGEFSDSTINIFNSSNTLSTTITNTKGTSGTTNGFIVKYNKDGNFLWSAKIGSISNGGHAACYGITADYNNDIFITGQYYLTAGQSSTNKIRFYNRNNQAQSHEDLGYITTMTNTRNTFNIKYDKDGNRLIWLSSLGLSGSNVNGVAIISDLTVTDPYLNYPWMIGTFDGQSVQISPYTTQTLSLVKYNSNITLPGPNGLAVQFYGQSEGGGRGTRRQSFKVGIPTSNPNNTAPNSFISGISIAKKYTSPPSIATFLSQNASISTILSNGYSLAQLSSYNIPKSSWVASGYTVSQLVSAGFTVSQLLTSNFTISDLSNTTIPKSDWLSSGQTLGNLVSAGYTPARLLTNSFTLSEVNPFYNGRLFVFDVSSSLWNGTYPINNTGGSFTGLIHSNVTVSNVVTATSTWTSYSKINSNDGLRFYGGVSYASDSKSINVKQFGGVPFTTMPIGGHGCFTSFSGVITATDVPTIPWNSLDYCFIYSNSSNYGNIGSWDVSGVTTLSNTFSSSNFNENINNWNVSNVTNMLNTFNACSKFNQPLNNWNVGKVMSMWNMFSGATLFNQDISNWNTSKVINMIGMFGTCSAFNQPLNSWDVGNVTTTQGMFSSATVFNQPLNNWKLSKVTTVVNMFTNANAFNQDISMWDISGATSLNGMFSSATVFNQPLNSWNVSKVTDIGFLFSGALAFNQPLNNWDTGNVTNMERAFQSTLNFNQPLNSWNVSKVTNMWSMFYGSVYNQPLDNWNVSRVTNMTQMFFDNRVFNQSLNSWNTGNVTNMSGMFGGNQYGAYSIFNGNISLWNTSKVTNMSNMFSYSTGLNDNLYKIGNWNYSALSIFNSFIEFAKVSPSRVSALLTAFSQNSTISNKALGNIPAYVPLSTTVTNALTAKNITFTANTNYSTFLSTYTVAQFYAAKWLVTDISSRNFTISALRTGGYSFSEISTAYSISQILSAGYTVSDLISNGFLLSDLSNTTIPKSDWLSSGQTLGNLVSAGYTTARLLTNSFTLSEVTPFYNGRLFVFDVSSSVWNGIYPITNTGGSLAGLINSNVIVGNVVTATSTWTSYNNLNVNDGLFFSNRVTYGYNKSLNIRQFGGVPFANMSSTVGNKGTFEGFTGVISATDGPTIPNKSLYSCFYISSATIFGNLNAWDVSGVTNMEFMFAGTSVNQPLNNWNTSSVTNMAYMFESAGLFNQSLNNWNTGNVTNMTYMFNSAPTFNQSLNNWNVSKVTNMSNMFNNARLFNQSLNSWNTGNVTDMNGMFGGHQYGGYSTFNGNISQWNTSKVTTMYNMFSYNRSFQQPIVNWDTGNVTNMSDMFYRSDFNQPIGNWNTSKVTNMYRMFSVGKFNQPIGNWDTGNVTNMSFMFDDNRSFNQPIENWNVSKVTTTYNMFQFASAFNQPLNNWNTGNLTAINGMFWSQLNFNQPLDKWNTSKITNMQAVFVALKFSKNALSLSNWNYSLVSSTNLQGFIDSSISPSVTTQLLTAFSQNPTMNNVNLTTIAPYTPIPIDVSNALAAKGIKYTPNTKYYTFLSTYTVAQFRSADWFVTDFSSRNFTIAQLKTGGYSLPEISTAYSISQMISAGQQLSDLSNCSYKKPQWTEANYYPPQLQSAGFSLSQLLQAEYALSDLSGTTYTSTQWTQSNITSQQLFNAGFKTTSLAASGFSIPTFSFQISQSAFLSGNSQIPVVNTGGSFQGLDSSYNTVNTTSNINIYWMSYTNNSPQDGLNLISTSYFNDPSINITKFSGIPLAFMSGTNSAAFYQFSGQITAPDVPTIPNRSLNACFYGSTATNLGNINGWDISNVTDLTSTFQNNTSFNTSLSYWNTRNVVSMRNTFSGCSSFSKDISIWDLSGVIPNISQGSMYNIINGTAINPDKVSVFLLNIINRYTA